MLHYIQKLHDENLEIDLVAKMQEEFSDFDISYDYATEHAGYFTFKHNNKTVVEFIITNFECHPFNMDDWLKKDGFDKKVKDVYHDFMQTAFKDYKKNLKEYNFEKNQQDSLCLQ